MFTTTQVGDILEVRDEDGRLVANVPYRLAPKADAISMAEESNVGLAALVILWADRDTAYAQSATALTDGQIASIRRGREVEANTLPPAERARAWAKAHSWYPPEHGQGSGADRETRGLPGWR